MKAVTILLLVVLAGFFVATRGNPTGDGGSTNQMTGSQHQAGSGSLLNELLGPVSSIVHGGLDLFFNAFFDLVKFTEEEKQKLGSILRFVISLVKSTKGEQQEIDAVLSFVISLKNLTAATIIRIVSNFAELLRLGGSTAQRSLVHFLNLLISLVNATEGEKQKIVANLRKILYKVNATKEEQQEIDASLNGLLSLLGINYRGNGSMPGGSGGNNGYTKGQGSSGNNKGYPIEGNGSGNGLGGPGGKSDYPLQEAPNMPGDSSG